VNISVAAPSCRLAVSVFGPAAMEPSTLSCAVIFHYPQMDVSETQSWHLSRNIPRHFST
jgi:hypothetical protein